jgi:hypothetical protein
MLIAFALVGVVALTNAESLVPLVLLFGVAAVMAASGFWGTGWSTPGRSGSPAGGCRRGQHSAAGQSKASSSTGPAPGPTTCPALE